MEQQLHTENITEDGAPAGGSVKGTGIDIRWQSGPLGRDPDRMAPNGAFVEGVIAAAIQRLEYYQESQFRCRENALAITSLEVAKMWLEKRTRDRESRGVEGTHEV